MNTYCNCCGKKLIENNEVLTANNMIMRANISGTELNWCNSSCFNNWISNIDVKYVSTANLRNDS